MLGFRARSPLRLAIALAIAAAAGGAYLARGENGDRGASQGAAPGDTSSARVERVVDGDTLHLTGVGSVRLIGVDTPETHGGRDECFGPEATAYVKRLLPPGTRVRYTVGEEPRDRYGRLLVYLYSRDGRTFVNHLLVSRGYATTLTIRPNDRHRRAFEKAEAAARGAKAGMWARPGCADR